MSRRKLIPLALVLAVAVPGGADAQQGVFVDPESPSGKEYAIPLEAARRQADPASSGTRRIAPGVRDDSPLFGEGIEAEDATAGGKSPGGSGGASDPPVADPSDGSVAEAPSAVVQAALPRPGAPDGGIGTTLMIGGGAALVLLAGGLAGVAIRRSRGPAA